jgi:hypothetical protein
METSISSSNKVRKEGSRIFTGYTMSLEIIKARGINIK